MFKRAASERSACASRPGEAAEGAARDRQEKEKRRQEKRRQEKHGQGQAPTEGSEVPVTGI